LKLNVGLRYAWTHFDFTNSSDGPTDLLLNGGVPALASGGKDETPFTPKVTLSEQLTPDDLVYVTVSKGYRIGGSTPPLPAAACLGAFPTQYNSDTVVNYEAGFKGRFDNRRLSVVASIYHINWNNIQQSVYVPACGLSYTTNSGNATSEGFDLQAQWQLTHHFRLEASVGETNAHVSRDAFDQVSGLEIAARGDALNVPPWNIAVAAQYDLNVMGHEAYVRSDYAYTGNRTRPTVAEDPATAYYDAGLRPDPAFAQLSLRSGLTMGKWAWALFMNNILNSHPQLYLNHDDSATALYLATSLRPRTVGISLSLKY
jgi:outer membrane receptor protein involved in Fe transport